MGNASPYGIVGFDPGNTSAVGIVDFEGNVLFSGSFSGEPLEFFARKISESCTPALFASDVSQAQTGTRKLGAMFGCRTWAPDLDLGVIEKRKVVFENFDGKVDVHERDALSAAFFCLFAHSGLVERARKKDPEGWKERVFRVLKGDAGNLSAEEKKESLEISGDGKRQGLPAFLKERILKERILSLEKSLLAEKGKRALLEKELALEKKSKARIVRTEKVVVENRALVRDSALEVESGKNVLASVARKRGLSVVLEAGKPAPGGVLYVRDSDSLSEKAIFGWGIRVVFSERGSRPLPCRRVDVSGRSIFNGRFCIVGQEECALGKEDEKEWQRKYFSFLSR